MEGDAMFGAHHRPAWLPAEAKEQQDRRVRSRARKAGKGALGASDRRVKEYVTDLRSPTSWADNVSRMDGFMQAKSTRRDKKKRSKTSSPKPVLTPSQISAALSAGLAHMAAGRSLEARDEFQRAAASGSAEANYHLGVLFVNAAVVEDADNGGGPCSGPNSKEYYRQARKALKKAADGKVVGAYRYLADLCLQGLGRVADSDDGFFWLDMAAREAGDLEAWAIWGEHLMKGLICKRDAAQAKAHFTRGAEAGHSGCQARLGHMHVYGQATPVDFGQAAMWYQRSMDQGDPRGMVGMAWLLVFGRGRKVDVKRGLDLFQRAADEGDAGGLCGVAYMYRGGLGVPVDFARARRLYEQVMETGDARGYEGLGWVYIGGYGVAADYHKAFEMFTTAAEDALPEALFGLGYIFWTGRGVKFSPKQARRYFEDAANRGVWASQAYKALAYAICEPPSQNRDVIVRRHIHHASATKDPCALFVHGLMIMRGLGGMGRHIKEAQSMFGQAAERGFRTAMFQIGVLHHVGIGVPKNLKEAERWYRLGAEMGSDNAEAGLGRFILDRNAGQLADEEAARFLEHAADCDNLEANDLFAQLCEEGRGCDRNLGKAQKCRDRAAHLRKRLTELKMVAPDDRRRPPPASPAATVVKGKKSCCIVM